MQHAQRLLEGRPIDPCAVTRLPTFRLYDYLRRGADVALSVAAILLTSPLFLIVALAVKLDSPGPVLYRQRRVGRNRRREQKPLELHENVIRLNLRRENLHGRPFHMIKFRSMYIDAEQRTGAVWACENDPRVTRVGRFLRRTRLDELPQLWNVLLGEMTFIGPRPERPEFVTQFVELVEDYGERHWVTPGITGLAQVKQGYDRCIDDVRRKVQFDLDYIRYRSVFLDLYICWLTVAVMFCGRGAR